MPENIGYTIVECSGEDAENPCTGLLAHTQDSKGWTTPRNGTFPQHITLQLDHPSRLQQVQLLSHEYKIAGKIELQVASSTDANDKHNVFTRLGFLSFDPNDKTNFSARELKSVTLPDVEATAVKLIIHRCHANTLNTNSQACLIMLNLVGEPLTSSTTDTVIAPTANAHISMSPPPVIVSAPPAPLTNHITAKSSKKPSIVEIQNESVDEVTAQRIAELQDKKAAAVAIEDYDEAKKLKSAIEKLRAVGAKMAALEARKKAAVDAEDYDTAKALKIELEKMRHRAYAAITKGEHQQYDTSHSPAINNNTDIVTAVIGNNNGSLEQHQKQTTALNTTAAPFSPTLSSMDSYGSSDNGAASAAGAQYNNSHHHYNSPGVHQMTNNTTTADSASPFMQKPTTSGGGGSSSGDWRSYDERPARAAGAYDLTNLETFNADSAPPGAVMTNTSPGARVTNPLRRIDENAESDKAAGQQQQQQNGIAGAAGGAVTSQNYTTAAAVDDAFPCLPAPPGFPSELALPEPLSSDQAKEAGPMEALVGEFLTRCLYSKSWQLKEAGMAAIATAVSTSAADVLPRLDGDGDALRLLCGVVAQGLKARIPAIAAAALVLLRSLVRSAAARRFPSRDMHAALTELLPIVAERAGDPAPRTREQAIEALVDIARVKESGLKSMTGIFLRPFKITESPKITQGRLQLLFALLPVIGVVSNNNSGNTSTNGAEFISPGIGGGGSGGFSAEAIVQFCCPALKSANAEVRSAAAELVIKIGRAPGIGATVVLPLLPVDVNPKLKEQLEEELTGEKKIRGAQVRPVSGGTSTITAGNANTGKGISGAAVASAGVPNRSRTATTTTSAPSSRRNSNAATATTSGAFTPAVATGGAAPRAQASSRYHSSTATTTAATNAKATKTSRPPSSSTSSQQQLEQRQQQYQGEYEYANHEERRPSQTSSRAPTSTSAMPPPQPQEPHYSDHHNQQQKQPVLYAEDTYTPSVMGPEFSVADEDPAPFEEELRRREATLGPAHPSVAEAASNLAIIYNQRGDGARALPLYQRALNIWEMTHGPHHPDVAHALTDIAVILLEAGHDVQGKQLLRRALDIQVELLGPTHPDVVAIKDVLDE